MSGSCGCCSPRAYAFRFLYGRGKPPLLGTGSGAIPRDGDWVYLFDDQESDFSNRVSYGILADGSLWAWGSGVFGNGEFFSSSSIPRRVSSERWVSVFARELNTFAVKEDGTLWFWGISSDSGNGFPGLAGSTKFIDLRISSEISAVSLEEPLVASAIRDWTANSNSPRKFEGFSIRDSRALPVEHDEPASFESDFYFYIERFTQQSLSSGSGYTSTPKFVVSTVDGSPHETASFSVEMLFDVISVDVVSQGLGYDSSDTAVIFSEPPAPGSPAPVTRCVIEEGRLVSVELIVPTSTWKVPTVRVVGRGSGAEVVASVSGRVSGITLLSGGAYRTTEVFFEFVGGNPAVPATFGGIMFFRGHLTYVRPTARGSGYTIDDSSGKDGNVYLHVLYSFPALNSSPFGLPIGRCLLGGSSVADDHATVDVDWVVSPDYVGGAPGNNNNGSFYSARTFLRLTPPIPNSLYYRLTSPFPTAAWLVFEGGVAPVPLNVFSTFNSYLNRTEWNATLPEGVSGCFGEVSLRVDWSGYETSSYAGQPPQLPSVTFPAEAPPGNGSVGLPGDFLYVPGRVEFYAATGCWSVVDATDAYTILAYSPADDGRVYWGQQSTPEPYSFTEYYPEWIAYASVPASSDIYKVGAVEPTAQWNPWVLHNPHEANGLSVVLESFSLKEGHESTYTATIRVENKGEGFTKSPKICVTASRFLPQRVGSDSDWVQVAMSSGNPPAAVIGLKSDGTLWNIRGVLGPRRQGYSLRLSTDQLQSNYASQAHGSPLRSGEQITQIFNTPDVVDLLMPHTQGGIISTSQIDPYTRDSVRTHTGRRLSGGGPFPGIEYINSITSLPTITTAEETRLVGSLPFFHSPPPPYTPSLVFPVRGPNTKATDCVCYTFAPSDLPHGLIATINSPEPCSSIFAEDGAVYAISESTGAAWYIGGPVPTNIPEEIAPPIPAVPLYGLSPGPLRTVIEWDIADLKGDTTIFRYPNWNNYTDLGQRFLTETCMEIEYEWKYRLPTPRITQTIDDTAWFYTGISVEVPGVMAPVVVNGGSGYIDRDSSSVTATAQVFSAARFSDNGAFYNQIEYSVGTKAIQEKTSVSIEVYGETGNYTAVGGTGPSNLEGAIAGPGVASWPFFYYWITEPDQCPSGKGEPQYGSTAFLTKLDWRQRYVPGTATSAASIATGQCFRGNVRDGVIIGAQGFGDTYTAAGRPTPGPIHFSDGAGDGGTAVWMRTLQRSGPFPMQGRHISLTGSKISSASAKAFVSGGKVYEVPYQDIPVPESASPPITAMRGSVGLTQSGKAHWRASFSGLAFPGTFSYWFSVHDVELRVTDAGSRFVNPSRISFDSQPSPTVAVADATIDGSVTSVGVDDGGSGYSSPPIVSFEPEGAEGFAIIEGPVSSLTVVSPGSGYTQPPIIRFSGRGYGASASAVVSGGGVTGVTVTSGGVYTMAPDISVEPRKEVLSLSLENGGFGYSTAPKVLVVGGCDGQPATASCQISASVTSVFLHKKGIGFSPDDPPKIFFSGGGGSGASAVCVINAEDGSVDSILITNGGDGYTEPPLISFSDESISATASIAGRVSSLALQHAGTDYVSPPAVLFIGGGGHGASASAAIGGLGGGALVTPSLSGRVVAVKVTNGGSGYQYPPLVVLSGGGGGGASCQSRIRGPLVGIEVTHGGDFYASDGRLLGDSQSSQSGKRLAPIADIVDLFSNSFNNHVGTATFNSIDNGPITSLKDFEVWNQHEFYSKPEIRFLNGCYIDPIFAPLLSPSSVGVTLNAERVYFPERSGRFYRNHSLAYSRLPRRTFSSEVVLSDIGGMTIANVDDLSGVSAAGISLLQISFASIDFTVVDESGVGAVVTGSLSADGKLLSVAISGETSGYTSKSVLQIRNAAILVEPCVADCEVDEEGHVRRIIVQHGGSGYFSPVAVVHGGGGSGCVVEVVSGQPPSGVLGIVVTNGGEGYSQDTPPEVFIYDAGKSLHGAGLLEEFNRSLASAPCVKYSSGVPHYIVLDDSGGRVSVDPNYIKSAIPPGVFDEYEDWFAVGLEISELSVDRTDQTPHYQHPPSVVVDCRADRQPIVEASLVKWSPVSNSIGASAVMKRDVSP